MKACCRNKSNQIVLLIEQFKTKTVYYCDCKECHDRFEITKNKKIFKVIIAGGRDFNNYNLLKSKCDNILANKIEEGYTIIVVSGTAKGADTLGERYAKERGYHIQRFPANWDLGKKAGYIRNKEMAQNGDALIAFWNGSNGTKHMIDLAKKHSLPTRVINY